MPRITFILLPLLLTIFIIPTHATAGKAKPDEILEMLLQNLASVDKEILETIEQCVALDAELQRLNHGLGESLKQRRNKIFSSWPLNDPRAEALMATRREEERRVSESFHQRKEEILGILWGEILVRQEHLRTKRYSVVHDLRVMSYGYPPPVKVPRKVGKLATREYMDPDLVGCMKFEDVKIMERLELLSELNKFVFEKMATKKN